MNPRSGSLYVVSVLVISIAFLISVSAARAQVQKSQTTTSGKETRQVQVENAEVVHVEGNDLIVRMADGTLRHIANVPESARVDVEGKELGIHDLKPGMKLRRTVTTTTVPKTITTVETVKGTIMQVNPPTSVILRLENGQNQQFKIPSGQRFTVNGQETDAWGLRKGMNISATRVTEEPTTQVQQQTKLSGTMPPPPPAPAADSPILIAVLVPVPATSAATSANQESAQQRLPQTAGELPLLALLGCLSLLGSAGLLLRKRR